MTWTYSLSNLSQTQITPAVLKDQTRFLIGDTDGGDQLLQDEEIEFAVSIRVSIYGAAAVCCRNLATHYARKADSAQGPLHTAYSQQSKNFAAMANRYENEAMSRGATAGYAGGISIADKSQQELDNDRVPPNFNIGMTDNFLPIAPAGNETLDIPNDDSQTQGGV